MEKICFCGTLSACIFLVHNTRFFYERQTLWLRPGFFLIFRQIQALMCIKCFLNLKTSSDNSNPDLAIVMQNKGCSGFAKHVVDAHSIFLLV